MGGILDMKAILEKITKNWKITNIKGLPHQLFLKVQMINWFIVLLGLKCIVIGCVLACLFDFEIFNIVLLHACFK